MVDVRPAVELSRVTKRFGEATALDAVELLLPAGRTTVLIGPSGCGKSTLLRLLVGLVLPDSGSVRVGDVEHRGGAPVERRRLRELRRRLGYVIQEGGLFPHLTARANAVLMARHLGWAEERVARRLAELCALTHFPEDGLERYPGELSGGQRQRVALMRALMLDPDLLLLDEPLGALDPMIRAELSDDLREIFRALAKTVVLVTHDMGEAAHFGDRIVLLSAGRVVQEGTIEDLLERPADPFVSRFVQAQRSPLGGPSSPSSGGEAGA